MKPRDVSLMPIMQAMCKTCPFGPGGSRAVRRSVEARIFTTASQTCHSSRRTLYGRDTRLCRGARNEQIAFFHRLGFLPEPTDAAWSAKWAEIQKGKA